MREDHERRMEMLRGALRDHHARVEPDPGFVGRVLARLPTPPDPLRWAALRLLPAGLALALLLGMLVWRELPAADPTPISVDELAAWVVDPGTEGTP